MKVDHLALGPEREERRRNESERFLREKILVIFYRDGRVTAFVRLMRPAVCTYVRFIPYQFRITARATDQASNDKDGNDKTKPFVP
jgi:hypothetical protein